MFFFLQQCHLIEAVSQSVYVTKDSLTALVESYHSHLQDIIKTLQQDESNTNLGENTITAHARMSVSVSTQTVQRLLCSIVYQLYCCNPSEDNEKRESSNGQIRTLLRELVNWSKKPTSAEFQHRYCATFHHSVLHMVLHSVRII